MGAATPLCQRSIAIAGNVCVDDRFDSITSKPVRHGVWFEEGPQRNLEWTIGELMAYHPPHALAAAAQVHTAGIEQIVVGGHPVCPVVIAGDGRNDGARSAQAAYRAPERFDRFRGGDGPVVDVSSDDHEVNTFGRDYLKEMITESLLGLT